MELSDSWSCMKCSSKVSLLHRNPLRQNNLQLFARRTRTYFVIRVFKSLSSPSRSSNLLVRWSEISVLASWLRAFSLFGSLESTAPSPVNRKKHLKWSFLWVNGSRLEQNLIGSYRAKPQHRVRLPSPAAARGAGHCGLERWRPDVPKAAVQM